jgi:hypothetical protein
LSTNGFITGFVGSLRRAADLTALRVGINDCFKMPVNNLQFENVEVENTLPDIAILENESELKNVEE